MDSTYRALGDRFFLHCRNRVVVGCSAGKTRQKGHTFKRLIDNKHTPTEVCECITNSSGRHSYRNFSLLLSALTSWLKTSPGENGVKYGKYVLQGIGMENFEVNGHGGLMSFQNDEKTYQQTLNIRNLDPSKLFPESQENSKSRHISLLIDPVHFTMNPVSKIIAKPGCDVQIQLQFVNKNILRQKTKSGAGEVKMSIHQTGFVIEENSTMFWPTGGLLFDNTGDVPEHAIQEHPRYTFDIWEEDRGSNTIELICEYCYSSWFRVN